jgi:hypothetical protein
MYLRGIDGDWSTTNRLEYRDGIYSITMDLAGGTEAFKFADADWGGTTSCGVEANFEAVPMPLAINNPLFCAPGFDSKDIHIVPEAGTYTFHFSYQGSDDGETATGEFVILPGLLRPELAGFVPEPSELALPQGIDTGVDMFLRGIGGDWGTSTQLAFQNGIYRITLEVTGGVEAFKFADDAWTGVTNCGVAPNFQNEPMPIGIVNPSVCADGFDVSDIIIEPEAGNYFFGFSYVGNDGETGTGSFQIISQPLATTSEQLSLAAGIDTGVDMFLRGIGGDWGTTNQLVFQDGIYSTTAEVAGGAEAFKFVDADWSGATNCGVGAEFEAIPMPINEVNASVCAGGFDAKDITIEPEAGTYLFGFSYAGSEGETGAGSFQIIGQNPISTPEPENPAAPLTAGVEAPATLYVVGAFSDWTFEDNNVLPFDGASGVYTKNISLPDGGMRISDDGWSAGTNCGDATGSFETAVDYVAGTKATADCATGGGVWIVPEGDYFLEFSYAGDGTGVLRLN